MHTYADGSRTLTCVGGPMCGKDVYVRRGETVICHRAGFYVLREHHTVFAGDFRTPLSVLRVPVMLWQEHRSGVVGGGVFHAD
jgi:hypothetical protein